MPDRRRFAVVATPLLALLGVAAAILLPAGAAPVAAQSAGPAVTCFEISVGWRICVASSPAPIATASPLPRTTLTYGAPTTTGSVTDDGDTPSSPTPTTSPRWSRLTRGLRTGLRDGTTIGFSAAPERRPRRVARGLLRLGGGERRSRVARGRRLLDALRDPRGACRPRGRSAAQSADAPDLLPPLSRHWLHRRHPRHREPHLHLDAGLVRDGESPRPRLARGCPLGAARLERHAAGCGESHANRHALAAGPDARPRPGRRLERDHLLGLWRRDRGVLRQYRRRAFACVDLSAARVAMACSHHRYRSRDRSSYR